MDQMQRTSVLTLGKAQPLQRLRQRQIAPASGAISAWQRKEMARPVLDYSGMPPLQPTYGTGFVRRVLWFLCIPVDLQGDEEVPPEVFVLDTSEYPTVEDLLRQVFAAARSVACD
jgi:hypothetical protein